jgi:hypothetical protein
LDLLAFTLHVETGRIVRLEGVDKAGVRHELSEEQKASLARLRGEDTLEALVEQAFEAGIACVLGGSTEQLGTKESEEEAKLRRLLLGPLIEHSSAKRLMQLNVLSRSILGTLLRHGIEPSGPEHRPAEQTSSGSVPASKSH